MTLKRKGKFKGPMAIRRVEMGQIKPYVIPGRDGRSTLFSRLWDSSVFRSLLAFALSGLILMAFLGFSSGCASHKAVKAEPFVLIAKVPDGVLGKAVSVPMRHDMSAWAEAQPTPVGATRHYVVAKGDCLWDITKRGGNPFLWPVIWKLNRDQIVDPDWIDPGMDLSIPYAAAPQDIEWAVGLAKARSRKPGPRTPQ